MRMRAAQSTVFFKEHGMFSSESRNRPILVAVLVLSWAVLFLPESAAIADNITYNIDDYPLSETCVWPYNGVAHVSGSITVSTGSTTLTASGVAISSTDITAATITIQTPYISYTSSVNPQSLVAYNLLASTTQLYLQGTGTDEYTWFGELYIPCTNGVQLTYLMGPDTRDGDQYSATDPYGYNIFAASGGNGIVGNQPSTPGMLMGDDPMVIGTAQPVPEPTTLTFLGMALLGLGVVHFVRGRWRRTS
jgi:hypothetical protein